MYVDSGCMEAVLLRNLCPQLFRTVSTAVEKVFQTMHVEIDIKAAFFCSCGLTTSAHAATTFPESSVTTQTKLVCSKRDVMIREPLDWRKGIWFQEWDHGTQH